MLLGITGLNCAGKDSVAYFLEKKGFVRKSLSDEIRTEAIVRGTTLTRENLINLGTEMRRTEGNNILVKRSLAGLDLEGNYSFVSIRNPEEVEEFRKHKGFSLIFVESKPEIRFERIKERNREQDPKTFKEFQRVEALELENKDSSSQQMLQIPKMADFVIENNGSFEELYDKIEEFLDKLRFVYKRPSWDEYFIELSRVVAKRATCDRGRSGCVIVLDKHILTTGYVGSPPGMAHCD
ncbi:AAA family ATPase, partial [Candidatus Micrarchaeota archaeon]|nr:AAA family ATPase [Candidatus Micrarchaeota archaeon]